jgi:hypothetical protein
MATQAEMRQWRDAVEEALNEQEGSARYQVRQRELRRGRDRDRAADGPRPLEFDDGGFPIPQPIPRFIQRVRRLIYG